MGSFAATCVASGFPIDAGDQVRWFLLTQNPYWDGGFVCDMHGLWVPRTWPIKAKYNDYGSIEGWSADDPLVDNVLAGLAKDLVEVGVGDNSIHDVAVRRGLDFATLLDGVWEGRVRVQREVGWREDVTAIQALRGEVEKPEPLAAGAMPTLQLVDAALASVERPANARYLVDVVADSVRVRWDGLSHDYGNENEWLAKAQVVLGRFFSVGHVAGTGSYSYGGELRVFRQPGKDEKGHPRRGCALDEKAKPLLVQQAMVREDVWQALISGESADWEKRPLSVDVFTADVQDYTDRLLKAQQEDGENPNRVRRMFALDERMSDRPRHGSRLIAEDVVPFSVGLASHYAMLLDAGKVTPDVVRAIAEFTYVHHALGNVRYVWRPGTTAGAQCGEWSPHAAFMETLAGVAKARAVEQDAERAAWDAAE